MGVSNASKNEYKNIRVLGQAMDKTVSNKNSITDESLIQSALTGDENAFQHLFSRYENKIYSICLRSSHGDAANANDICQETFISAFDNLDKLRDKSRFQYWLYEIARNKCVSSARKQASIDRAIKEYEVFQQTLTTDKDAWTEATFQIVEDIINKLEKPDFKETVKLFYLDGLDTSEIAKAQDITVTLVTTRLNRFRTKFRKVIINDIIKLRASKL